MTDDTNLTDDTQDPAAPVTDAPVEETPAEETPAAEEMPAEETPAEEPAVEETPVEEAKAEEMPGEGLLPEEPTPAVDAPSEEVPATGGSAAPAGTDSQGRQLYDAKCSNCGKDTQVPFEPDPARPVYCRDCLMLKREERKA